LSKRSTRASTVQNVEINPNMQAIGKDPKTELQECGANEPADLSPCGGTQGAAHQTNDVECEIKVDLAVAERGIGASRRWRAVAAAAMLAVIKALPG
jgi:ribonuclease-3